MIACINEATTMTSDFETDMWAYSAGGFVAVELWLDKVTDYVESKGVDGARRLLSKLRLDPVCACAQGGLMLAEGDDRAGVLSKFKSRLQLCQALGVPKLVAFAGRPAQPTPELYHRIVSNIREAADLAADYGVTLALEFIGGHPVVGCLATTLELARQADRPNVGILLDFFHFMAGTSKMADLDALTPQELAFVHVNDGPAKPREMLADTDRVWMGEGCFPISAFRGHLTRLGYAGGVSIELFNHELWDADPYDVAAQAFKNVTAFIEGRLREI